MLYKNFKDIKLSRLGMGNMRLPIINGDEKVIDYEKGFEIIDALYKAGVNYYDTAYVYHFGTSEKFVGKALGRYDRNTYYVATKYNIWANPDYKKQFEEQLANLEMDYIDFYLIHCLTDDKIDEMLSNGCIDYFKEQKRLGRIKYLGFSTHASVATTERFLDSNDWDFCQIQLNYYDWNFGNARLEYEAATKRNIPVIVMESVRGGRLVNLTPETREILDKLHKEWNNPAWAFNFLKSLDNVYVALSGMSTLDQALDNINTYSYDYKLNEEEMNTLFEAVKFYKKQLTVPCTGCRYCTKDCPKQINIPEYLTLYNKMKYDGALNRHYLKVDTIGKANECISCKKCMGHCPQNIEVPKYLHEIYEKIGEEKK